MGKSVVVLGDADVAHCSGMVRAGASPNVFVNGIAVSRQGDPNTSHQLPPKVGDPPRCLFHAKGIAVGSLTVKVNGKGIGRTGDSISGCTACGQGSTNVFAG